MLLLGALHWIYVALGAFAAATLVTLVGAVTGRSWAKRSFHAHHRLGSDCCWVLRGVMGLIGGCVNLFHATRLSLVNIREEAELIRARQEQLKAPRGN